MSHQEFEISPPRGYLAGPQAEGARDVRIDAEEKIVLPYFSGVLTEIATASV